jgi:anaerobic selenocysteine-containing dehydrogenase
VAETQAVLWMRMLDRRGGPDPPSLLVVDPRTTPAAEEADIHLAVRSGTNLALMNALVHELFVNGWYDDDFLEASTIGRAELEEVTARWSADRAAKVCDVPAPAIRDAAALLGGCRRLVSTVLQGFYQSHQATASACQVNNIHLMRGMVGRPGAGVLQMNGQPTAQNTRETGADGDLPGFRNWSNRAHIEQLARLWNVDPAIIPHWSPPTHAMQIIRYAEQGSIELLWISATNPAVSLPDLARVRRLLAAPELFVVVQDIFLTETARLADVVLPAATSGEKLGTFTNADRTVHVSEKAVEPPGEARADLDIFVDYARRMAFTDRDGEPLIGWRTAEEAFDAWKECSRGRPCDYTGLTYEALRGGSGIQWPCHDDAPEGTERLYADGRFNTDPDVAETFGQDLATGAEAAETEYRAKQPDGRAFLKAADYEPAPEEPDDEYPMLLDTGRTIWQFHTRTKTGRVAELNGAAPEPWVELHPDDAASAGLADGDLARVDTRRGHVVVTVRTTGTRPGVVFVPFHFGYWDVSDGAGPDGTEPRAANELTMTHWDPVSKQPAFKSGAARVGRGG